MGTTYSISITHLPAGVGRSDVQRTVDEVLADADAHLSGWSDASELARFNASRATDWQPVSRTLLEAVALAQSVSAASGGAFDITVGPLVRAWGFGAGALADPPAPSDAEVASLMQEVGHSKLELGSDPPRLRKAMPGLAIDLDGIAPGWAVDRIADRFESLGIGDYLIELGGEVRGSGRNPDDRPWRVAVETPLAGVRRAQAIIELDGTAVSTSGDYRDYREVAGARISHTIDPRNGRPITHGLASVTVVSGSLAEADAWATALMVLGVEQGMPLARRTGMAVLFVQRAEGGAGFVEIESPEFTQLRRPPDATL